MTTPEPGIYDGIPDTVYHNDTGSLSSSGARKLLPPSSPAHFRWSQDNPQEHNDAFEFGHAAHALVLGEGAPLARIGHDKWTTKAAKDEVAAAREAGSTPLKPSDYEAVHEMAAVIKQHPVASVLLTNGRAEQSIYWDDEETGVRLRCRPDWLPNKHVGRMVLTDYKTALSAAPSEFGSAAARFGYHQQAAWYIDGVRAAGLEDDAGFLFLVQEKKAPYAVSILELDSYAIDLGRRLNRQAINTYAHCMATGEWPGYDTGISTINLPKWAAFQQEGILNDRGMA